MLIVFRPDEFRVPRSGPLAPVTLTLPRFTRTFIPPGSAIVRWRVGLARLRVRGRRVRAVVLALVTGALLNELPGNVAGQ